MMRKESVSFAPGVVLQIIDGEALLLKLHEEEVFSLNETGARVAELISSGHSVDALVGILAEEYGVGHAVVARDVDALLDALRARGLLAIPDPGTDR
jgi:hypothetical protein